METKLKHAVLLHMTISLRYGCVIYSGLNHQWSTTLVVGFAAAQDTQRQDHNSSPFGDKTRFFPSQQEPRGSWLDTIRTLGLLLENVEQKFNNDTTESCLLIHTYHISY